MEIYFWTSGLVYDITTDKLMEFTAKKTCLAGHVKKLGLFTYT